MMNTAIRNLSIWTIAAVFASAGVAATITFEETLDSDGTIFDTWDKITDQYQDDFGVTFDNGEGDGFTIFNNVLPNLYVPNTAPVIVSSRSAYGLVSFDEAMSSVSGFSTVSSSRTGSQGGPNPDAALTIRALASDLSLIDEVVILRNYGDVDGWTLSGEGIAMVEFSFYDQGTSADRNYWWSLDSLSFSGQATQSPSVPEPSTILLVAGGIAALATRRKMIR